MSKKHKKNRQMEGQAGPGPAPADISPSDPVQSQGTEVRAADAPLPAEAERQPARKYFYIFWGIIILALASSWILAVLLPTVHESFIERWIMVAMAAALAVFLLVLK